MGDQAADILPFVCAHAPFCGRCGVRMSLARHEPDPSGGRYMFEIFSCRGCSDSSLRVRPIRPAATSRVYDLGRRRRFRPTG